jgi:hypothetical protein
MDGPFVDEVSAIDDNDARAELVVNAREATIRLTSSSVQVIGERGLELEVSYQGLRRIELDIEHDRPATFVIVPHDTLDLPQVLSLPAAEYAAAGQAIAYIGRRLAQLDTTRRD